MKLIEFCDVKVMACNQRVRSAELTEANACIFRVLLGLAPKHNRKQLPIEILPQR